MNFSAVVFDMDGVLIDSEKFWELVEMEYLRPFLPSGFSKDKIRKEILGRSIFDTFTFLNNQFPEKFNNITSDIFIENYEKIGEQKVYSKTNLLPGVRDFLEYLLSNKTTIAIGSSSPKRWIKQTLIRHELKKYFSVIVSGCQVKKTKPDPEIYNLVAKNLNISADKCIAIEDSKNGVSSAKAAGMFVFAIRNGFNSEQNLKAADAIFHNFFELKAIFTKFYEL